jgi:hypothetical protein
LEKTLPNRVLYGALLVVAGEKRVNGESPG